MLLRGGASMIARVWAATDGYQWIMKQCLRVLLRNELAPPASASAWSWMDQRFGELIMATDMFRSTARTAVQILSSIFMPQQLAHLFTVNQV
jgi:hypothetical protein